MIRADDRQTTESDGARPLVSVVIPTRNRATLLAETIESLEAQTYTHVEIIIVDDGSTDDTPGVIREAARRNPRLRAIRHETSRGAGAARNAGAELARGEYLLFEDDDCRGRPERIGRLVDALDAAPGAAYAYCFMSSRESDGSITFHDFDEPWAIGTPYALIRRSAFRAAGGFDTSLPRIEDFDLWTRLLARGWAVGVSQVLFETVRDPAGISGSPARLREAASRLLEKYQRGDLPPRHLAAMHRRIGGALLMHGYRTDGLTHFRRALRFDPISPRSWVGLIAAAMGPAAYRLLADAQAHVLRRRTRLRSQVKRPTAGGGRAGE